MQSPLETIAGHTLRRQQRTNKFRQTGMLGGGGRKEEREEGGRKEEREEGEGRRRERGEGREGTHTHRAIQYMDE